MILDELSTTFTYSQVTGIQLLHNTPPTMTARLHPTLSAVYWTRLTHTLKAKRTTVNSGYLVGVVGKKSQGCGNAALGCQQTGVLTHLLSQQNPDGISVRGLGELYSFSQDHNFLNQILSEKRRESERGTNRDIKTMCMRGSRKR